MFEELRHELSTMGTPKFHVVDGPASEALRATITQHDPGLPHSYRAFVLEFGNAKLYRRRDYYEIEIYAGPRLAIGPKDEELICFGRTRDSLAYFKPALLAGGEESPVFEWDEATGLWEAARGFSDWFEMRSADARGRYPAEEWASIKAGPTPFDLREQCIVEARREFHWRKVGVSHNGDVVFEIRNASNMSLPFLSIGIRGTLRAPKSGPLHGTVYLPVSSLAPGQTKLFEQDCYKKLVDPSDIEPFELPDPAPQDRARYKEFL